MMGLGGVTGFKNESGLITNALVRTVILAALRSGRKAAAESNLHREASNGSALTTGLCLILVTQGGVHGVVSDLYLRLCVCAEEKPQEKVDAHVTGCTRQNSSLAYNQAS